MLVVPYRMRAVLGMALFLVLSLAMPVSAFAHDETGSAAGDEITAAQSRDIALQSDFADQLQAAPVESMGACLTTIEFDGVGEGCRTRDGMLRLEQPDGTTTLTHGPDFLEGSADVAPKEMPTRTVAAVQGATKASVDCVSSSTRNTRVFYAVAADGVDRSATQVPLLRQSVYELSAVIDNESRSLAPTLRKRLRVLCDGGGNLDVQVVHLPTRAGSATFGTMSSDIRNITGEISQQGVSRSLVYYDGDLGTFAGIADIAEPNGTGPLSSASPNNGGALVAMQDNSTGSDAPNWQVLLHEVTHNMGAVVKTAPDSNNVGHCNDGLDVMCYAEPGTGGVTGVYVTTACAQLQYDCDHDTYFNPAPAPSDWIASHWNVAASYNAYLTHDTVAADTAPPTVPTSLAAVGHGSYIHLTWGASTDVGGSGVHAYRAYRSSGGAWVPVGDAWPDDLTVDVSDGIVPSTGYSLQVRAYDARGNESAAASVTVNSGATDGSSAVAGGPALAPPTNVVVSATTTGSIDLSWDPPSGEQVIMEVAQYVDGDGSYFTRWQTSYTSQGFTSDAYGFAMTAATRYRFRLTARDANGRRSAPIYVAGWTRTAPDAVPPAAPTGLAITPVSGAAPALDWDNTTDAVSYVVARRVGAGAWSEIDNVTESAAYVPGLAFATTYDIGVAARDEAGNTSTYSVVSHSTGAASDTTPPTIGGLSITSVTQTSIGLSWGAGTDNVGVVGYRVLVGTSATSQWTPVATTGTTATASGLLPGTQYRIAVISYDAAGNTSFTGSYFLYSTNADTTPPTAPSSLVATARTSTSVDLAWAAANDNVGVVQYKVFAGVTLVGTTTALSLSVTGLTHTTSYSFTVRAYDSTGNNTAGAPLVVATRDGASPSQPGAIVVGVPTSTTLPLTWGAASDNVAVTAYRVYRQSPSPSGPPIGSPTSAAFTPSGLAPSTSYTFRVTAVDAEGNESSYAEVTASTVAPPDTAPPSQPGSFAATSSTTNTISLTWTASTDNVGVVEYRIYRDSPSPDATAIATTAGSSVNITGLSAATTYVFRITARDAAGYESAGAVVSAATIAGADTQAPSAPGNLVASAITGSGVTLTWAASADDTGVALYKVVRTATGATTVTTTTSATTLAVTGLVDAKTYTFTVTALDAGDNESVAAAITRTTLDTTSPSSPATVSFTSNGLAWTAATDNVSVASYRVTRTAPLPVTPVGTTATTSIVAEHGLASTMYAFSVVAVDAAGNASAPVVVSTTNPAAPVVELPVPPAPVPVPPVPAAPLAPSAPTGLTAVVTSNRATFTWSAGAAGVTTGYRVSVTRGGVALPTIEQVASSIVLGSLAPKTALVVSVVAVGPGGASAAQSFSTATLADHSAPGAPGKLKAVSVKRGALAVVWSAAKDDVAVVAYEVRWSLPGKKPAVKRVTTLKFTISRLKSGTSYTVQVRALDAAGNGSVRATAKAKTK